MNFSSSSSSSQSHVAGTGFMFGIVVYSSTVFFPVSPLFILPPPRYHNSAAIPLSFSLRIVPSDTSGPNITFFAFSHPARDRHGFPMSSNNKG